MANYTVYKTATGEITKNASCSPSMAQYQTIAGESYIEARSDDLTQYILNDVVTDKPPMPCSLDKTDVTADGVDVATLANVPAGAKVFSNGVLLGEGDGTDIEIDYDLAGVYPLRIKLFPYLDFEGAVSAT